MTSVHTVTNLRNMAAAKKQKPKEFDESVLQGLVEPITVVLEKIVSGQKSPIELPPGPGETIGGKGYTADMIRTLPGFISNTWTGGGMYHCVATGTNAEQMKWEMFFPPQKFAEIIPPTQTNSPGQLGGAAAPAPVAPVAPVADHSQYLAQIAQTYPHTAPAPAPVATPRIGVIPPSAHSWALPQMQGMAPMPPMAPMAPVANPYAAAANTEREQRMKLEAKMDRQAQDAQHAKDMASLTQEMRRMQENQARAPSTEESSALKAANEKITALEQQGSTQMLLAQMTNMQNSTNQMFEKMQANTTAQIDAMRRESESSKGDPTLPVIMQMMTQQAAAADRSTQTFITLMQGNQAQNTEQTRLAQANQMSPREMVEMFRSANTGSDKMAEGYAKMQELMFSNMDAFMQAQGPGVHPAVAMIGNTLEGAVGSVQQYIEMKQAETQANAQATAIRAQVEGQTRVATAKIQADAAAAARSGAVAAPKSSVIDNPEQLETGDTEDTGEETVNEEELPVDAEAEAAAAAASITEKVEEKEALLFGEAMEPIMRLRKGVKTGALDSAKIAAFVLQAVDHVEKKASEEEGKEIPPVFELFKEERYADLIDVLLPDSKPQFREEVTGALYAGVTTLKNHPQVNSSPPEAQPAA